MNRRERSRRGNHANASLPQSRYFYTYRWSKRHDEAFIEALTYQATLGHKQMGRTPNQHSLLYAQAVVNSGFAWPFGYGMIKNRLDQLCLRYNTFDRVLRTPRFRSDLAANVVHASNEDWQLLTSEVDFANAYRFRGEPNWEELHIIFEPNEGVAQPEEFVELSSGSDDGDSSDSDEYSMSESDEGHQTKSEGSNESECTDS